MCVCVSECVFQCVGVFYLMLYLVSLYVLHVCGPAWSDINSRNGMEMMMIMMMMMMMMMMEA